MVVARKRDTFKQVIKRYRTALSGKGTIERGPRGWLKADVKVGFFSKTHSFLNRRSHVRVMPGSPNNPTSYDLFTSNKQQQKWSWVTRRVTFHTNRPQRAQKNERMVGRRVGVLAWKT